MASVAAVPGWVAGYINLPYAEGGRSRAGLDCFGLLALIYQEVCGVPLHAYDGPVWRKNADPAEIADAVTNHMRLYEPVPAGRERPGDGILLRMRGVPLHVALVVADGIMLHIHETAHSCLERYRDLQWRRRILGFYRHAAVKGFAHG